MENKPVWQSKTVWMNLAIALGAFVPPVQQFIVEQPQMVAVIWSVLNIIMRLISKGKIEFV